MYLLETAHSSFCSRRIAPTSRVIAFSLEKMPTTLVRRLICMHPPKTAGVFSLILSSGWLGAERSACDLAYAA